MTIVPPLGRLDLGGDRLDAEEGAHLVDLDHLLELLQRGLGQLVEAQDARVVDEAVDRAEGLLRGGDRPGPVLFAAHVEAYVPGPVLADLLGHGGALLVQHVTEEHLGPLGGEEAGLLLALAPCGAGDDHDAPVQLAHGHDS